jgi:1,4-dihydroxy-2-naphthoyl-CoA hydrolase
VLTSEQIIAAAPFTGTLGVSFAALEPHEVRAELEWTPELSTIGGRFHGGVLMSLADIAATVCAILNASGGAVTTTVESTSHFLAPVHGRAVAVARPLRVGRRTIFVEVDVLDPQGKLCGRTTQVQAVLSAAAGEGG